MDFAACGARTFDQRGVARPQGAAVRRRRVRVQGAGPRADADADARAHGHAGTHRLPRRPRRRRRPCSTRPSSRARSAARSGSAAPAARRFEDLDATHGIPLGSTVDAKDGKVEITSVPKKGGKAEKAVFFDGIFKITQPGSITQLALTREARRLQVGQGARRGHQAEEAPAVGRRQGEVPHQGPLQRGHRARHQVAGRGHLRRHADQGHAGQRVRARHAAEEDDHRPRRQELQSAATALMPRPSPVAHRRPRETTVAADDGPPDHSRTVLRVARAVPRGEPRAGGGLHGHHHERRHRQLYRDVLHHDPRGVGGRCPQLRVQTS